MTTRTVDPSQLLTEATLLQQRLQQTEQSIGQMEPENQLVAMEQVFLDEQVQLQQLQQKANDLFSHAIEFDPTSIDISDKLSESVSIIQKLEHNQEFLLKFSSLFLEAQEVLNLNNQTVKIQKLGSLLNHSIQLAKEYQDLNPKNGEALVQLTTLLSNPSNLHSTTPQHQPSAQPIQTNRQIVAQQDKEYQASLRHDQFKDLKKEFEGLPNFFVNDPAKDFEVALAFYQKLKTFSFGKASDTFPNAIKDIDLLLKDAEEMLNLIIKAQAENEAKAVQTTSPTQTTLNPVFAELKNIVAELITAQSKSDTNKLGLAQRQIQPTFNKLNETEKKALLNALNAVLKQSKKIKEDLSETATLKQPLALWGTLVQPVPANWSDKKQALEKVISGTSQSQTPVISSKVAEMKRRMQEVMNAKQPVATTVQPEPRRTASSPQHQVSTNNVNATVLTEEQLSQNPLLNVIDLFKVMISPFQTTSYSLIIDNLEKTINPKCTFKISTNQPTSVADRPNFHLYFIHKNEAPQKLKDDLQYGRKALLGEFPAENSERTRAVQRTMVEIAIQGLEDAINFNDGESIVKFLNILEEIKLDSKDRVNNQECIAFNLYGAFYQAHVAARTNNTSLVDPNAPQFQGDFGRHGMRSSLSGIDPAVKLSVINKVLDEMKAAWKL